MDGDGIWRLSERNNSSQVLEAENYVTVWLAVRMFKKNVIPSPEI